MTTSGHDVTALLHAWTAGDSAARDQLMTVVYQELRRRAAGQLRREGRGHTLQPTALCTRPMCDWSISGGWCGRTAGSSAGRV